MPPLPLVGRGWGWGSRNVSPRCPAARPPTPTLPHKGGASPRGTVTLQPSAHELWAHEAGAGGQIRQPRPSYRQPALMHEFVTYVLRNIIVIIRVLFSADNQSRRLGARAARLPIRSDHSFLLAACP